MRSSKFTKEQSTYALKQAEARTMIKEVIRKMRYSSGHTSALLNNKCYIFK